MDKWIDFDPHTKVRDTTRFDSVTGLMHVTKEEDVEPLLDATRELANSGATDIGIKKGLWHYASIPLVVQYKLLTKYGININNRDHWPRMIDVINADFPYLKTTSKTHRMKGGSQIFAASSARPNP